MAYKKGDAQINKNPFDARADNYSYEGVAISLPHSCDEWVIGGKEEVGNFIDDLQELIKKL